MSGGLTLPLLPRLRAGSFDLVAPIARNPARDGRHRGHMMGQQLWTCELETTVLDAALAGEFAWLKAQADGELTTVYLYNIRRPRPLYGIWGSAVTITATSRADRTLTLAGLKSNQAIAKGDMCAWDDGPARRLHILGAAQANGSGAVTVRCEPPPPATVTASLPAPLIIDKPCAEFALLGLDLPYEHPVTTRASIKAIQVIRRV